MNNDDYNKKMIKHLTQSSSYKKLTKNLISRIIKEVKKVIKSSSIDDKTPHSKLHL
jgi:hypothetical protein